MKKTIIFFLTALLATATKSQIIMSTGGYNKYDVSQVDSVVFTYTDLPSTATVLEANGQYTIFTEALQRTGLSKMLLYTGDKKNYEVAKPTDNFGNIYFYPRKREVKWTVFAENDEVFKAAGINNFNDLVAKCREWYANPTWYDHVKERAITISIGDDYENEWNVLHMFVAYHILNAGLPVEKLVYETSWGAEFWNYCFGYEPQNYWATLLPATLLKIWQTNPLTTRDLWLNRYVKNNTLTDQYATFGSDAMHPLIYSGAKIYRNASLTSTNSFIHSIDHVLLYDQQARDSQHERMRFSQNHLLPELANNGIYGATTQAVSAWSGGGSGARVLFAPDYFENLRCNDENTNIKYNVMDRYYLLESTSLRGEGPYDISIRIPNVPSGKYELRVDYTPNSNSGLCEYYVGNSSNPESMQKVGEVDIRVAPEDPSIGWESMYESANYTIESEKKMRQNGYMYGPVSYFRKQLISVTDKLTISSDDPYEACKQMASCSSNRSNNYVLRYVVTTIDIKQGQDYWLRMKSADKNLNNSSLSWLFNFMELVPIDVANHDTYMEDWY